MKRSLVTLKPLQSIKHTVHCVWDFIDLFLMTRKGEKRKGKQRLLNFRSRPLDDFEGKELKSAVSHLDQVVSEPEGSTGNQKPVSTEIHQSYIAQHEPSLHRNPNPKPLI